MKKGKWSLLFFCMTLTMYAQESKTYNYFHPEYEDSNRKKPQTGQYNNNCDYFHDVALERGAFIPTTHGDLSDGTIITLHGSHFLNDKFGFRSGISYIYGLEGSNMYWKAPFLFAFRTGTISFNDDNDPEFETLRDYYTYLLLNIIPKRFEFNAGVSLGYMTPDSPYYPDESFLSPSETMTLRYRFASSVDANMRIIYQIGQLGLHVNAGVSYLWTRNYIYSIYKPYCEESHPAWFANLSIGASFRF
jgi:hypothetical protein